MSKKLQLTIPKPCHENWEGMTPVEKGKFCGSCQKQVVDFSNMSDRQVAQFFKKPSTGSVCGRFMTDQLDREMEIPRKRIPWVKYFFQFVIPAFLVSIKVSAQTTKGKIKVSTVANDTTRRPVVNDYKMMGMVARPVKPFTADTADLPVKEPLLTIKGEIQTRVPTAPVCSTEIMGDVMAEPQKIIVEKLYIKGKVISETGAPVPFATIVIKGTSTGVAADANGEFSILPGTNWEKIILVSTCVGFESTEIVVDRKTYTKGLVLNIVAIKLNYELMGAVIITKCYSQKISKPVPVIPDLPPLTKAFFVYPNPALAGDNLTIEWKEKEEGYYTVRFLNLAGQAVHQQEIWIDAEAKSLTMDMPVTTPGSYFLVLANKKTGKKFTEKIIIQ